MSGRTGEPFGRGLSLVARACGRHAHAECIATDCACMGAGCDWCVYGTDVA